MLLRFAVENHLSICERQELVFAASSLKDPTEGLIHCESVESRAIVPAVVIYGANASGKSNFVDALSTMRTMVLWSQIKGEPAGGVTRYEFLLDKSCSEKPSCFEIDFVLDGICYHYGFEATDEAFSSEWLYQIPKAHRRKLYERNGQNFDFGRSLKGQNLSIARLTRPNSLFLSAAAQNGHELLSLVYEYFQSMKFAGSISAPESQVLFRPDENGVDRRVIDFLKFIDTGVAGYRNKETELSEDTRARVREPRKLPKGFTGHAPGSKPGGEVRTTEFELAHRGRGGEVVHLDLDSESAGTRRLLAILSQAFRAMDEGRPLIVDELDVSLHAYASEAILSMFCSREINKNGAQLMATAHDTNLMQSDLLRRDQIWFAEKSTEGATEIFPLTDIRTRKGDNIELGYLQGRYGAVPSGNTLVLMFGAW